jgi:hypothetical protein
METHKYTADEINMFLYVTAGCVYSNYCVVKGSAI